MEKKQVSKEVFQQLQECETVEEITQLLAAKGITVTQAEAEEVQAVLAGERDLTEEELAQVAGGLDYDTGHSDPHGFCG